MSQWTDPGNYVKVDERFCRVWQLDRDGPYQIMAYDAYDQMLLILVEQEQRNPYLLWAPLNNVIPTAPPELSLPEKEARAREADGWRKRRDENLRAVFEADRRGR